ncbi:hypothetical protein DSO57_1030299 [Entomophthora muscae]|uniref:Uncharacterized protein n=1 Tax=Entomophthora muscae TaxID=34485 RepID=A0ACC2TD25_9FUNG|nr:hypothetical protein DSO57_1030299 [Entomophthora muscae]
MDSQHLYNQYLPLYLLCLGLLLCVYLLIQPSIVTLDYNEEANRLSFYEFDAKSNNSSKQKISTIKWIDYLLSKSPSLSGKRKYYPTPWLFNSHLQTYYTSVMSYEGVKINYERQLLPMEDGGQVALDWYPSQIKGDSKEIKSIVVFLHGLTGSSREGYIRETVNTLTTKDKSLWVVVLNNRGCGDSELLTPRLFNGGDTRDLKHVLSYIQDLHPSSKKWAIGYSLGSNILVKYLGEAGKTTPLSAAVSISNPCDLVHCSSNFSTLYFQRTFYNPVLGSGLIRLFNKHKHALGENFIEREWVGCRHYDRDVTSKMNGFKTVNDYYRWASSDQYITRIKIPLLMFTSTDDPISPAVAIPYQECKYNPYVLLATTDSGGHIGWWTGVFSLEYWFTEVVHEYLSALKQVYDKEVPDKFVV